MDRGARILVLTPEAYGGFGGISVASSDLVDALSSLSSVGSVTVVPRLVRDRVPPVPEKVRFIVPAARGAAAYLKEILRLAPTKFDFVISTHVHLLPVAEVFRILHGTSVLCVLHGTEAWTPTRRTMVDRLAKRCSELLAVSACTRERFLSWSQVPEGKVTVLPNCVRLEKFGMRPRPGYLAQRYDVEGCRVVMTLGRLDARERQKGIDELIEIMPRLVRTHPDVRCLIAGDGDDRPRLAQKVRALSLDPMVRFCGRVREEEKSDHYNLSDVFCLAGRQEGFGIVYLEALACGAPVVGSRLDGSRDALLSGTLGELADPDDPQSLFDAVEKALMKPRQVPAGLEHFSFDNLKRRLDTIVGRHARQGAR